MDRSGERRDRSTSAAGRIKATRKARKQPSPSNPASAAIVSTMLCACSKLSAPRSRRPYSGDTTGKFPAPIPISGWSAMSCGVPS